MIECLNCKKEFESKSPLAKFCGVNCRVAYHREHGKNKSITPLQMQVLYNTLMEKLEGIQFAQTTASAYDGKKINPIHANDEPLNFSMPKIPLKSFEYYRMAKKEIELEEDWVKMKAEIMAAPNLSEKQKNILITTNI